MARAHRLWADELCIVHDGTRMDSLDVSLLPLFFCPPRGLYLIACTCLSAVEAWDRASTLVPREDRHPPTIPMGNRKGYCSWYACVIHHIVLPCLNHK